MAAPCRGRVLCNTVVVAEIMPILTWILQNWRLVASFVLLTTVFVFGYTTGKSGVQKAWDSEKSLQEQERKETAEKHRVKIQELEIQRDKDAQDIADYKRTHPSVGVHVPPRACGGLASSVSSVQATTTKEPFSGAVALESTGSEHGTEQVNDAAIQKAFDSLDIVGQDLALEADVTTNDCRVAFEYLKSLKPKP